MLVLVSDLHLTDGTTSTPVHPGAFRILRREIEAAARDKGTDKAEVNLVLLGDIFDLVRTDYWFTDTSPGDRPWNGALDSRTAMNKDTNAVEKQFKAILDRILQHGSTVGFIKEIQRLRDSRAVSKFQIDYVVGNHDRALNNFPSLQKTIEKALGVRVTFRAAFSDPAFAVTARHGHEWDANCSARLLLQNVLQKGKTWDPLDADIGQVQNLGEVITAELMSGLVWRVKAGGDPDLAEAIRDVDLLRPATSVFQWVEWRARSQRLAGPKKDFLVNALIESLSGVVDSAFGRLWDNVKSDWIVSADLVDRLEMARSRLKAAGYDGLREIVSVLVTFSNLASAVIPQKAEDYDGAKEEFRRCGQGTQYVIYGHTHRAQQNCLSGDVDGTTRMYVNTGTYLPLLEVTDDGRSFAQSQRMTLTFLFNGAEDRDKRADKRPTLDFWVGVKRKNYA
jgi:UDP-2,3-diacylglucosamine pyrophosphatase LpxH